MRKARIIKTGVTIEVYKLVKHVGMWCDASDCTTKYKEKELNFL